MEQLPRPATAVFAASDAMAVGAIKTLAQANLRVPDDISVAGYDDDPIATLITPPLTTVRQPVVDLGKAAVESLINLLENPDSSAPPKVLSTCLIPRGSTRQL
jgi:LacI family transcriptional regulator